MDAARILYESQEHQKWLHQLEQRHIEDSRAIAAGGGMENETLFSPAHSRGLDAAESAARKREDIESDAAVFREPSFNRRLSEGFKMLGME